MSPAKGYSETGMHISDSRFCLYFNILPCCKGSHGKRRESWMDPEKKLEQIKGENSYLRNLSQIHSSILKHYSYFFKCTVTKECLF